MGQEKKKKQKIFTGNSQQGIDTPKKHA